MREPKVRPLLLGAWRRRHRSIDSLLYGGQCQNRPYVSLLLWLSVWTTLLLSFTKWHMMADSHQFQE